MSTGGLAIALAETPHKFRGLYHIGLAIFILDLTLFTTLCTCMLARALLHPAHFKASFLHPQESLFFGAFWLSISVIIGNIQAYGVTYGPAYPWLLDAVYALYWVYAACSLANSLFQYWMLIRWSTVRPVPPLSSLFLAGYSAMLTGTIASMVAGSQAPRRAVLVLVSGCAYQGFGWLISSVLLVGFVRNLLDNGLPPAGVRPSLFIPVGSVAYTAVALIGQALAIPEAPSYGYFARYPMAGDVFRIVSVGVSIFIWLFSFWIFALAFIANVSVILKMPFSLSWWAFIFPNVGLMTATAMIGRELESEAIMGVASAMTILLVAIWLLSCVACIRAVWQGKIAWPGQDEDKGR
ncbi:C4-dicarboxylate transporter/malic acid transport protein [Pyrenochaeta sp. DS3sAY3a]|nr:C4-dicarboxylate transporter/malic acid transport protein [Pyrenochaeta sp. DS3sAY3a]